MRAKASSAFPYRQRDFEAQVELFKGLARSAWIAPPDDEADKQAMNIRRFRELSKAIADSLSALQKQGMAKPSPEMQDRMASLAICMYLFDIIGQIHEAVVAKNKSGLYSLYDSVRNSAYGMISAHKSASLPDIVKGYMEHEPRIAALAELCDVELIPLKDAVALYEPKLRKGK
jgi:hypothetical protein